MKRMINEEKNKARDQIDATTKLNRQVGDNFIKKIQ